MPEEINRILTDHSSDILFTPTNTATINLKNEGIGGDKVHQVGDVMYDAAIFYGLKAENQSNILKQIELESKKYILVTIHRAENTNDQERIRNIIDGLGALTMKIVLPLHPRTAKYLNKYDIKMPTQIEVIEPVGYLDMVMLEKHAAIIATDSGGVQKEAYFHGVPCITLRNETEWFELVDVGANTLVGANKDAIIQAFNNINLFEAEEGLYGDGTSGDKIARLI